MIIISLDRELFYPLKQAYTNCEIARLAKIPKIVRGAKKKS